MVPPEDKKGKKTTQDLGKEPGIGDKHPGRNANENSDTEQTRIENRREADLEDKTPAGDAGVEDNTDERQANDPIGESNY